MIRHAFIAPIAIAVMLAAWPAEADAATFTGVVRYGPYFIPGGTHEMPGMIEDQVSFGVPRPCIDCYITSFTPDLVYLDGSSATMDSGAMLHHMVLTSQFARDATCGDSPLALLGQRFFAAGDERTVISFPEGYGYKVNWFDSWNLVVELMNHTPDVQMVFVEVTVTYRPSWEPVKPVTPVWLDIDPCGDSEYSIPAGFSDTHWDWTVNVPGTVVSAAGHVHGHGIAVEATNESRGGTSICRSEATLDPMDTHRVLAMGTCVGDPLATLRRGQTVRLHSEYQSSHAADDVMGIMLLYIHPRP